ncbi:transcriptional regulator Kaiso-like [Megalops cyprinoides]|uniref:transcriptional regulator Kaiso-like n=1 Tax=Megalops cyprinoides TaxID=118141 RepID=UPI0018652FD7|nr:transcriptional regulator Kaiso-like [Megalops cyprinoides]
MSSIKLISAADTQYSGSLLKSFNDQRINGLFCDVTIIVQNRKFKAHRNILSASSTYFHQLFSVAGQVIELNFINAEIFEEILNYIYSAKIVRVRSDKVSELIKSGQTLGVKFIANLGQPLAHVKGLPDLSKDTDDGDAKGAQNSSGNVPVKNDLITQEEGSGAMPIITEAFSLSAEEFNGDKYKDGDSDSDDVLFVSKQGPQNTMSFCNTKESRKPSEVINVDESSAEKDLGSKEDVGNSTEASSAATKKDGNVERKDHRPSPETVEDNQSFIPNSSSQTHPDSTSLTSPMEQESPDSSTNMPPSPSGSSSQDNLCSLPALPGRKNGSSEEPRSSPLATNNHKVIGVQKKRVTTVVEKSTDKPGDFKIKLTDVRSENSPKDVMRGKKMSDSLDSLSSSCKSYTDIGERNYDIVPAKDDPGEGDSKASRKRKSSPHSPDMPSSGARGKKKPKVGLDDHYELIMDGKTFYVCIVCKRPYVCLTSLKRHFNVHSWEKKYPCHYCDKVFALAEYRTKHEIQHTGERRYQCLLCSAFFINYQLLSSHCKQVHNQDPSGRKEKEDTDNNLYRLLPCRTLEIKSYSYMSDEPGTIPIINEDGIVYHVDPRKASGASPGSPSVQGRVVNWDDIFVESGRQSRSESCASPSEDTPEFEFVIPETY